MVAALFCWSLYSLYYDALILLTLDLQLVSFSAVCFMIMYLFIVIHLSEKPMLWCAFTFYQCKISTLMFDFMLILTLLLTSCFITVYSISFYIVFVKFKWFFLLY